jgi:alanyl-tRNA synthetase
MSEKKSEILEEILREEKQFVETLEKGLKEFEKLVRGFKIAFERSGKKIDTIAGNKAFRLYDTFGFPLEMTVELAIEADLKVDIEGFKEAEKKHQELSRTASAGKFKG